MSRVGALTEKDAPYEFLARELMGFAALKSGNDALAREQFGYLDSIPGVPASIKERAKQSLSLMRTAAAAKKAIEAPIPETTPDKAPVETPDEN